MYKIDFHVTNIAPLCNYLLGKLWIHSTRAIPSFLHQKLKFIIKNKVVSIRGEENIISTTSTNAPYLKPDEDILESSF